MCPIALVMDGDVPPAAEAQCCDLSHRAAMVLGSAVGGAQSGTPQVGSASPLGQAGPGSAGLSAKC